MDESKTDVKNYFDVDSEYRWEENENEGEDSYGVDSVFDVYPNNAIKVSTDCPQLVRNNFESIY